MAEKKINGRTFKTGPLLATEAIKLQARLLKVLAPALDKLPAIFKGAGKSDADPEAAASNAAAIAAFGEIFNRSNPDEIATLVKDVTELALIKRPSGAYESVDFDGEFSDRLGDIIPVVVWVLREQFGDFFSGALGSGVLKRQATSD